MWQDADNIAKKLAVFVTILFSTLMHIEQKWNNAVGKHGGKEDSSDNHQSYSFLDM